MNKEGATQSTAITAPPSNSRITKSSSSSSRNVRNNVGEEGGEKGGQQLNRVDDEENQRNGSSVVSSPCTKKSKPNHQYPTRSKGLSITAGSPRRKKSGNNSNNSSYNSYNYNNNLRSSSSPLASQLLLPLPPNNVSRLTTSSNTSLSNESSGVSAAEVSTATTSQVLSNVAANALSSNNNVNNSNAITSSNTNNGSEHDELCIMDKSCLEEGWGTGIKRPQKVDMMAVMEKAMKEITLDRELSNGAPPALQPIGESSDKVISIHINKSRKEVLSLLGSGVEYSASVATTGSDQPTKQLIQSLDQPTTQEQMNNNLIVGEKFIFGTWITATFVLIINPATGNVIKKLSSMQCKSGSGKEYNDPDKCVEVVIGSHDVPSHLDELPKEWLSQIDGGSYRVRITVKYLKWIQNNPDARLRHVFQCLVVSREVYVKTPEVDAAREAEFVELAGIAQVFMNKRNPSKSSGEIEVFNTVECDEDFEGVKFKVEDKFYRRGDQHLHTYDSVNEYVGKSRANNSIPMSAHCSKWYHSDVDRPTEYDNLLIKKRKAPKKGQDNYSIPEGWSLFKEGSIYYESGFLWKANNGTYVWVRKLP